MSEWKRTPKRDLVKYGKRAQVVVKWREMNGGSACWGPWQQEEFPAEPYFQSGDRRSGVAKDVIENFFIKKEWLDKRKIIERLARKYSKPLTSMAQVRDVLVNTRLDVKSVFWSWLFDEIPYKERKENGL